MTATNNDLLKRIADLEAALSAKAAPARQLTIKAGAAGGLSVYGLNVRFPVTLYANQWIRLIDFVPEIKAAIAAGKWAAKDGTPIVVPAGWVTPSK
jgi:hypothetical protein